MISRTAAIIAGIVVLAHLCTLQNYGYFGDEFYFIDCAKHLAWSYVDQPPLIPLIAWFTAPFGYALWALRLLPALAAGATVIVSALLAKELGGGRYAQLLTAIAVGMAPIYLLLGSILSTSAFEPLTWTLLIYLTICIINRSSQNGDGPTGTSRDRNKQLFVLAGLIVTLGLYAKFSIAFCVLALLFSLLLAHVMSPRKQHPQLRILASPWFAIAAILCVVLISPILLWQWHHSWPMLEVLHRDALNRHALGNGIAFESANVVANSLFFLVTQALYLNPLLIIICIWGLLWLGFAPTASRYRFIAIAYVLLFAIMVALTARGYYLAGFYPVLFAAGGIAIENTLRKITPSARVLARLQTAIAILVVLLVAVMVPFAIPILPIDSLIAYSQTLGISRPAPPDGKAHLVQPLFADEFGWEGMTQAVARAYTAIPAAQRETTAVFADGYMYAGALNFYGPRYQLPTAISGNNNYYLWGPGNYAGGSMLAVGATDYPIYTHLFRSVKQIAVYTNVYRWMIEGPLPIYLCTDPRIPLTKMWPLFKKYGL